MQFIKIYRHPMRWCAKALRHLFALYKQKWLAPEVFSSIRHQKDGRRNPRASFPRSNNLTYMEYIPYIWTIIFWWVVQNLTLCRVQMKKTCSKRNRKNDFHPPPHTHTWDVHTQDPERPPQFTISRWRQRESKPCVLGEGRSHNITARGGFRYILLIMKRTTWQVGKHTGFEQHYKTSGPTRYTQKISPNNSRTHVLHRGMGNPNHGRNLASKKHNH